MTCRRFAPALLLHVNIFLVLFAGAALATGARLAWDPSTYLPLRELFPQEYRLAAAALPPAAAVLLLLAHLSALALRTRRPRLRRALLLLYAVLTALLAAGEVALAGWLRVRMSCWARSPAAAELRRALHLRDHLRPLLHDLAHWHTLPTKLDELMQEAQAAAPRNLHAALAAALLLLLLQAAGVLLALLLALRPPRRPRASRRLSCDTTPLSTTVDSEKTPLKAVYKNGRLMMV